MFFNEALAGLAVVGLPVALYVLLICGDAHAPPLGFEGVSELIWRPALVSVCNARRSLTALSEHKQSVTIRASRGIHCMVI